MHCAKVSWDNHSLRLFEVRLIRLTAKRKAALHTGPHHRSLVLEVLLSREIFAQSI